MSDGVLLVFESIDLNGQTLSSWVDTRIKESTTDGTSEIVKPKKSITMNTYPGFTYELRGLGNSTNIILQKATTATSAVLITYAVSDPKNKGYQKEVDAIVASIKLLK